VQYVEIKIMKTEQLVMGNDSFALFCICTDGLKELCRPISEFLLLVVSNFIYSLIWH